MPPFDPPHPRTLLIIASLNEFENAGTFKGTEHAHACMHAVSGCMRRRSFYLTEVFLLRNAMGGSSGR